MKGFGALLTQCRYLRDLKILASINKQLVHFWVDTVLPKFGKTLTSFEFNTYNYEEDHEKMQIVANILVKLADPVLFPSHKEVKTTIHKYDVSEFFKLVPAWPSRSDPL